MTQTGAIFLEAYRSLNAKKMFWIVLVLSGAVVLIFAAVGINQDGVKIVTWQFDSQWMNTRFLPPAEFYKSMFVNFGIAFWLSWLATILALISTAGIFPDLMTGGAVDLVVSKPISRLRLFITQYFAGLLFVTLQVTIFCLASFLVIGLRGGAWEPGLFLAVPLVVCFFSYLFSICVLLGVLTRSTLASLLFTLLFWFVVFIVGTAEQTLLMFQTMDQHDVTWSDLQEDSQRARQSEADKAEPSDQPAEEEEGNETQPSDRAKDQEADEKDTRREKDNSRPLKIAHNIIYWIKMALPKTNATIGLLERSLIDAADLPKRPGDKRDPRIVAVQKEVVGAIRGRSAAGVLGTSLGFEFVVLAFAALIFCRRDF